MTHADWATLAIVAAAIISVGGSVGLCIKFFFWPGETSAAHIKRRVLQ